MKTGITTFDLENFDFQVQLNSMLKNDAAPDFVILHYAGMLNSFSKYFRFLKKTLKNYRFKSLSVILHHNKTKSKVVNLKFSLSQNDKKVADTFLKNIPIIKVKGINDKSTINKLRKFQKALIVSNSGILKEKVLNIPDIIFLNIHASRLPQYRGMNNVEWALYENNDIYMTIHKISKDIDEGDILYQERIDIDNKDLMSIEDYRNYCFFKSNEVIGKAIKKYLNNEIAFSKQEKKYESLLQYYVMHPLLKKRLQEKLAASKPL